MAVYTQDINVAQINDALVTYAADQSIVPGLTALKAAIIAEIDNAADCVQCAATGKINAGVDICPLCNGMTKTEGQYKVDVVVTGYSLAS